MMVQGVSISEMVNQSITVLSKPSVATFEQYERRGGQREALIYVAIAAGISALAGLLRYLSFGVVNGLIAAVLSAVGTVAGYYVFSYAVYWMGKQQGGTGTQDEVFYTTSLYVAPLLAIGALLSGVLGLIPFVGILAGLAALVLSVYQIYLAYLATRSGMNLDQNKAIITVAVAFIAQFVVSLIIGAIVAAVIVVPAMLSGAVAP
ncbi:MAG: YIP1 family protein [Roseiflexaceae bacterium]|nr:YIP1 family protein [Roseiflexaceae bacterium]